MLKINNYDINEGEQSVFDSELKGRKAKDNKSERSRAGHDYDNQPMCQVCWAAAIWSAAISAQARIIHIALASSPPPICQTPGRARIIAARYAAGERTLRAVCSSVAPTARRRIARTICRSSRSFWAPRSIA